MELHLQRSSPEKIFDEDNGLWAVPSSADPAIFAPLYQEQGSFKGAHYVTAAEEANGALPFHGFNFVLVLQPYDAVSSCNDDNLGTQVFMVPCNLLEMLYAFVFSQEYGVSQYERYPVSFCSGIRTSCPEQARCSTCPDGFKSVTGWYRTG